MTEGTTNTLMLAVFIALGVMLVAGLVVIPEIEQQAALADKGGVPNTHAAGHGKGKGNGGPGINV
jgi:hypothetical protein